MTEEKKLQIKELIESILTKMPIAELAYKMGCSVAVIYNWKAGRNIPNVSIIKNLEAIKMEISQ